jgi:glycosyltransferase involved in cell wall biosynthesis
MNANIGIFIPAYQAEKTLSEVLQRISETLWDALKVLVIIDDGSKDTTRQVAESWQIKRSIIRIECFNGNQGYGAAVRQGLAICRELECEAAVCLHADGQYPPEQILEGLELMRKNGMDLLQGSRHQAGTALAGGMPFYKYAAGKTLTAMENRCFGLQMTDYHSGYLMYGSKALRCIPFAKLSGYFDFDLEVIATARAKGLNVGEMAIPTRYSGEVSHLNSLRYGFRTLGVMLRYRRGYYAQLG